MEKSDKRKYKGGTLDEVYQSICRTVETDGVSEHRIIEDIVRIKNDTLPRIIKAKGTYIDDSTGKSCRSGVRGQEYDARPKMKVDPEVRDSFKAMIDNVLQSKQSCPIIFDLSTGDSEAPLVGGPGGRPWTLFPLTRIVRWNLMKMKKRRKTKSELSRYK